MFCGKLVSRRTSLSVKQRLGPTALNHSELFIQDARQDTQAIGRAVPAAHWDHVTDAGRVPERSCAPIPTGQVVPEASCVLTPMGWVVPEL